MPALVPYSQEAQALAVQEWEALREAGQAPTLLQMLDDYGALRARLRGMQAPE